MSMEKVDSFNVMDELSQMYVFNICYSRPSKGRYSNRYRIDSSPFNFRETCVGALYHELDALKAKGMVIDSYCIEKVLAFDTEKQF